MKLKRNLVLFMTMLAVALIPSEIFAASASAIGSSSSMSEVIRSFFAVPLVKGVIMVGTIGGGLYLVLKGLGVLGGEGGTINIKQIVFGGILTAVGLGYNSITTKIADTFIV